MVRLNAVQPLAGCGHQPTDLGDECAAVVPRRVVEKGQGAAPLRLVGSTAVQGDHGAISHGEAADDARGPTCPEDTRTIVHCHDVVEAKATKRRRAVAHCLEDKPVVKSRMLRGGREWGVGGGTAVGWQ